MGRGKPEYVMVTKERRKSGCIVGFFHLIGGMLTLGVWPIMVWVSHRLGPKRKTGVTRVYRASEPPQVAYPYAQPPAAPQPYYPPAPAPQPYPQQPYIGHPAYQDRPSFRPAAPAPIQYSAGQPPQPDAPVEPPPQGPDDDPWDRPTMRRRG
jgi:hypothetical protein